MSGVGRDGVVIVAADDGAEYDGLNQALQPSTEDVRLLTAAACIPNIVEPDTGGYGNLDVKIHAIVMAPPAWLAAKHHRRWDRLRKQATADSHRYVAHAEVLNRKNL